MWPHLTLRFPSASILGRTKTKWNFSYFRNYNLRGRQKKILNILFNKFFNYAISPVSTLFQVEPCTVSTNSEKFPNIFGGSDSNLQIWKNYLIYKFKTHIFGKIITYYISLNQLLPNIIGNFSEVVLTCKSCSGLSLQPSGFWTRTSSQDFPTVLYRSSW